MSAPVEFERWLNEPLRDGNGVVLDRLAELIFVNGGTKVSGWGIIGGGGPYGRTGLDQEEALELIFLDGILNGYALALGDWVHERAVERVREAIDRRISSISPSA